MSYQETNVSLFKKSQTYPRCLFPHFLTHVHLYMQACMLPYHAQNCMQESADVIVLMIITMMVFIYVYGVEKGRQQLNECSVRLCGEQSTSQEGRGRVEDGEWGRGVNSSLFGEREKRESLLCLHVNVVPHLIDHIYVLVCQCVWVPVSPNRFPH